MGGTVEKGNEKACPFGKLEKNLNLSGGVTGLGAGVSGFEGDVSSLEGVFW